MWTQEALGSRPALLTEAFPHLSRGRPICGPRVGMYNTYAETLRASVEPDEERINGDAERTLRRA